MEAPFSAPDSQSAARARLDLSRGYEGALIYTGGRGATVGAGYRGLTYAAIYGALPNAQVWLVTARPDDLDLTAWWEQVFMDGLATYLELRWRPELRRSVIDLRDVDPTRLPEIERLLRRGIALLEAAEMEAAERENVRRAAAADGPPLERP